MQALVHTVLVMLLGLFSAGAIVLRPRDDGHPTAKQIAVLAGLVITLLLLLVTEP